ncbi:MAG: hypothetical protein KGJ13_10930, partial [Patescibacteria group bacterium]|nr:hypothetical protein [Patescibacteria group bacterium]
IGIFSIVVVSFITIFLVITRVQVRQASLAEVNGQSQYLLQELQYYIGRASLISIPQDTPTTTLELRMPDLAEDPTWITLQNGTLYLQQTASGTPQPLSSDKVTVSDLSFIRRANTPGHDSVSISFSTVYRTSNVEQLFSEAFQSSVARVAAATFDSDVLPATSSLQNLGFPGMAWSSINGIINFKGSNIGINTTIPSTTLTINGILSMNGNRIVDVALPINSGDVATKAYVDQKAGSASSTPAGWTCQVVRTSYTYSAQASCSGTQKVISGGCSIPAGDTLTDSEPVGPPLYPNQGWYCADTQGSNVSAFANCCQ